jgi:hypothetical protein
MLRGTKIPLEEKVHDIKIRADLHNRFDIEVVRGGEVVQRAVAHNVVCNSFFAAPITNFWNVYIRYGSGSGTPAATDTQLFNEIGYQIGYAATNYPVGYDKESNALSFTRKAQILENENVGATITEVGTSSGTAANTLKTHAMLKDMNGNDISIVKTATDIINIYATIYLTLQSTNGIIIMPAEQFMRMELNAYSFNPATLLLSLLGATSTGDIFMCTSAGPAVRWKGSQYTPGNFTMTVDSANKKLKSSTVRIPAASENYGGIGAISLFMTDSGSWGRNMPSGIVFVPGKENSWYSGSSIVGEAIGTGDGTTTAFATAFPFVKNGAKIYVNGVEQTTGVTVMQGRPGKKNIAPFMNILNYALNKNAVTGSDVPMFPGFRASARGKNRLGRTFFENPYYSDGIDQIVGSHYKLYCSDTYSENLADYILVNTNTGSSNAYTIGAAYKNKRYWALQNSSEIYATVEDYTAQITEINCNAYDNFKNIVFDTPPAAGAVITADYTTALIAKDANHVFDFSFEISLGDGSL